MARKNEADAYWSIFGYLVSGLLFWGGVGYFAARFFDKPVLTLVGDSFASRVAASLLNAIGLPELIANTQEEYEDLAIDLATNPHRLTDIKMRLDNNRLIAPLFDTPLFAKNLEAAYIKMYERYQTDLQPDYISVV
jgi:hypothetical protein